jgi:hypothetical protein
MTDYTSSMKITFLSLPPFRRFQLMCKLTKVFATNARVLSVPFMILSYGSVSYGFHPRNHGKLDDLDFFLVIPRDTDLFEFAATMERVFLSPIQLSFAHLASVLSGKYDMCRMYGLVNGVKVGFRIMCQDTLETIATPQGSLNQIRNVASIGQSRIVTDKEWSFTLRRYVRITYPHDYQKLGSEQILLVLHSVFSKEGKRLGALGRKLLTMTVVHDVENTAASLLSNIWSMFVQNSEKYCPNASDADIVNSIMRSERFSDGFKRKLREKVAGLR